MIKFLKDHPTIGGAALSIAGVVLGIFIKNPELVAALVLLAGTFLGIHQVVTPVAKVEEKLVAVATQTAEQLNSHTAGAIGEVTDAAHGVVNAVVDSVLGRMP